MVQAFSIPSSLIFFATIGLIIALVWFVKVRGTTSARWRAGAIKYGLLYLLFVLVLSVATIRADDRPFWPAKALNLLCLSITAIGMYYSWRDARRKAALEPASPPAALKPPRFIWQATLILLPVVIMAVIGGIALVRDRTAVENEAQQRAGELIERLQAGLGRRVAAQLTTAEAFGYQWLQFHTRWQGSWPGGRERAQWDTPSISFYRARLSAWQQQFPGIAPESMLPNQITFTQDGELDHPTPAATAPEPPDWYRSLTPEQQAAWLALRYAEARHDGHDISNCVARFLDRSPPKAAQANAQFILVREASRHTNAAAAFEMMRDMKWGNQSVRSESGLPLVSLAFAEMMHFSQLLGASEILWTELGWQVTSYPSPLVPLLLDQAEALAGANAELRASVAAWRLVWESEERARAIAATLQASGNLLAPITTSVWVEQAGQHWLCLLQPGRQVTHTSSNGVAITITNQTTQADFYPVPLWQQAFVNALADRDHPLPPYFGFAVELEGKPVVYVADGKIIKPPPAPVKPLATGIFQLSQPGVMLLETPASEKPPKFGPEFETFPSHPRFTLRIDLADRGQLFAAYRQRLWLFGGLIGVSVLAALVGVLMAGRAFLREQRLNTMKSNFVSSVSHELRAPIASVRLLAESLERGKISEPQKQNEYFRFIGQECRRLSALIENVLDFSRIEQGRKQYEFEPTDLSALVEQTVKLMRPYAEERGVVLQCEVRSAKCEVELDGRAIQQALVNLVDNAIKHSPQGETVMVKLETSNGQRPVPNIEQTGSIHHPPSTIHLSVSDRGPGIPASEHEKIFERFYRLGSELRRETQGVGIGLSIVKHVVEAHGGCVRVESEVGQGSRFTIELPGKQTTNEHR